MYIKEKVKLIKEKTQFIEKKTGNKVILEIRNDMKDDACVDFGEWYDMSNLPKILYKSSIDKVHILHELIHLENFFIEKYRIIAHYNSGEIEKINKIEKTFKDIPEDYITHKIIWNYGFDPIKESWFKNEENNYINTSNLDLTEAVKLVRFYTFSEFCPEDYKKRAKNILEEAKQKKPQAYLMAKKILDVLKTIDYKNKESYNSCLNQIINIFAPDYCSEIHPSTFIKKNNKWIYYP